MSEIDEQAAPTRTQPPVARHVYFLRPDWKRTEAEGGILDAQGKIAHGQTRADHAATVEVLREKTYQELRARYPQRSDGALQMRAAVLARNEADTFDWAAHQRALEGGPH